MVVSIGGFIVNLVGIFIFQHGGRNRVMLKVRVWFKSCLSYPQEQVMDTLMDTSTLMATPMATPLGTIMSTATLMVATIPRSYMVSRACLPSHSTSTVCRTLTVPAGIFLHILADTLGSVGVIISSTLIYHFGKGDTGIAGLGTTAPPYSGCLTPLQTG